MAYSKLTAALMLAAMAAWPCAVLACEATDIEIRQADIRPASGDRFRVVGELFNRCDEPTSPDMAVTFRDAAGKVLGVQTFSPPGAYNIGPNTSFPFESRSFDKPPGTASTDVRVIGVVKM